MISVEVTTTPGTWHFKKQFDSIMINYLDRSTVESIIHSLSYVH